MLQTINEEHPLSPPYHHLIQFVTHVWFDYHKTNVAYSLHHILFYHIGKV